eukprot:scaffold505122_cov18-Prasinocladus_malaysianus.AAC.1
MTAYKRPVVMQQEQPLGLFALGAFLQHEQSSISTKCIFGPAAFPLMIVCATNLVTAITTAGQHCSNELSLD